MERIIKAIREVFPEMPAERINENLILGGIPGWDSMNSINLQIELEKEFSVDLSDVQMREDLRISDVLEIVNKKANPQ